jgi:hypothetical protein
MTRGGAGHKISAGPRNGGVGGGDETLRPRLATGEIGFVLVLALLGEFVYR